MVANAADAATDAVALTTCGGVLGLRGRYVSGLATAETPPQVPLNHSWCPKKTETSHRDFGGYLLYLPVGLHQILFRALGSLAIVFEKDELGGDRGCTADGEVQ